MVEAVVHCHRNDVIHRDVKFENFLIDIDYSTNNVNIKLTDFGLSRVLKHGE